MGGWGRGAGWWVGGWLGSPGGGSRSLSYIIHNILQVGRSLRWAPQEKYAPPRPPALPGALAILGTLDISGILAAPGKLIKSGQNSYSNQFWGAQVGSWEFGYIFASNKRYHFPHFPMQSINVSIKTICPVNKLCWHFERVQCNSTTTHVGRGGGKDTYPGHGSSAI